MTKGDRNVIRRWLLEADEALRSAALLQQHGYLAGAVNRTYYACFYVASALLLTRDISSARHAGIRALFYREFVQAGLVEERWGTSTRNCSRHAWQATIGCII